MCALRMDRHKLFNYKNDHARLIEITSKIHAKTMLVFWLLLTSLFTIAQAQDHHDKKHSKEMTINVQNIELRSAILLIAKILHMNVLISSYVSGITSIHLQNAEPDALFDLLLKTHNLAKIKNGNIYYIAPYDEILKRQQKEVEFLEIQQKSAHLSTIIKQINYGSAQNIASLIKTDHGGFISDRGTIKVDKRTNTIAVYDVPEHLAIIQKLIHTLDVPVKQILIEARIASVDHDCECELGINFAVHSPKDIQKKAQNGRYSIALLHLPDGTLLDFKLAALERHGRAELISSPSLSTANLEAASIEAGEEVPYQEVSESGGTAVTFKKAVLGLKVTPEVLPNSKVLLKLQINQDRPSQKLIQGMPTINTRQIITNVLVGAGQTVVLGGIYESNQEVGETGIPILSQIPLLGWLFKMRDHRASKRELLIFVTPKIVV